MSKELKFEPFTIWMNSDYGRVPIRIDSMDLSNEDQSDNKAKLHIEYELLTNHEDFPQELLDLSEDESNEFLTVIRVAIHNTFIKMIDKELNESE